MIYPGFVGAAYQAQSPNVDAQQCVNLYPEADESGSGKVAIALYSTPGLRVLGTCPKGPIRALWAGDNRCFVVGGDSLYEMNAGGVFTLRGVVGNDGSNSPAQIFPNGNQILIVSAGLAYYDNGAGVSALGIAAKTGAVLDGYGILAKPNSKQFQISAINDFSSWDPLEFAVKEGYPDNIAAILTDHKDLWVFGDQTTQIYRNTGNADFPFETDPGAFIQMGCIAPWSAVRLAGGVAWLGSDSRGTPVAYRAQGFTPVRVSTHALEDQWRFYLTVSDCIAYSYHESGHHFWVLTFPTANATWVYDATLGLWHRRAFAGVTDRQRQRCHCYVFGSHLVGDHTTGAVYVMDSKEYDDNGTPITWMRVAPHISDEQENIHYHRFWLDVESGSGTTTSVELSYSDDGGHTFTTPKAGTLGAFLNFKFRVLWRRLGKSRNRVFLIKGTSDFRVTILQAFLKVSKGVS